jgi:hypothetical protein
LSIYAFFSTLKSDFYGIQKAVQRDLMACCGTLFVRCTDADAVSCILKGFAQGVDAGSGNAVIIDKKKMHGIPPKCCALNKIIARRCFLLKNSIVCGD